MLGTAMLLLEAACDAGRSDFADPLDYLFTAPRGRFLQISSYDTTGGNRDRLELAAGDSAVLADVPGPGVITRLWITVSSRDPHYLRRIALKMYWDDEETPSVYVPLGDFFGNGFTKSQRAGAVLGMSSGGFYSYLPMPFARRARIVAENGTGREIDAFYFNLELVQVERLPDGMPTLHAWWNRDIRTDRPRPHVVLDAHGSGRFIGLSLNAESYDDELEFLEGDESFWVDGEFRGQGTGTEDYFNAGWYFDQGPFQAPFHGLVLKDESRGRIAAYRWQIPDPVDFRDSILVLLEHGHANQVVADYATVAYWYQAEPHAVLPPLPPPGKRLRLSRKIPVRAVLASDLSVRRQGTGATVTVPVPRFDRYEVYVFPLGGPGLETVRYRLHGNPAHSADLGAQDSGTVLEPVSLGEVAAESEVRIEMEPADAPLPAGVLASPVPEWPTAWNVVGPFPNPRILGTDISPALDSVYEPETDPSLDAVYRTSGGERVHWRSVHTGADGQVRLNPLFTPNDWVAAYGQVFLFSPTARRATLLLGADDAHELWLNGAQVSQRQGRNISHADDIAVDVRLNAGWNRLLIKVADLDGGWAFQVRVADPDGDLRWSVRASPGSTGSLRP